MITHTDLMAITLLAYGDVAGRNPSPPPPPPDSPEELIDDCPGQCDTCSEPCHGDHYMRKAKAFLYVLAGIIGLLTGPVIMGLNAYAVLFLNKELPMVDNIVWFWGAIILSLLGVVPYIQDVLARGGPGIGGRK